MSEQLPFVILKYAQNNSVLSPIDARDGTVASITFAGMETTEIQLHWAIKDQAEPHFPAIEKAGNTTGSVDIDIPWQWVSSSVGHTVLIWYTAVLGGEVKKSFVLELEVQQFREADLKESLPVFTHADSVHNTSTLNMHTFSGDETVTMKAWPLIQAGQRLYINVVGDQHIPAAPFYWVAFDHVVTEDEAHEAHIFEFTLSRGWMSRRQDYSALTTQCGVIFDGTPPQPPTPVSDPIHETHLPANTHEFHPRTTTLLLVDPAPQIHYEHFDNQPSQLIAEGLSIDWPALKMRITLLQGSYGTAGVGRYPIGIPDMLEGPSIILAKDLHEAEVLQRVQLDFRSSYARVRFASTYLHFHIRFLFFDEQFNKLHEESLKGEFAGGRLDQWVDVSAPPGKLIKRIVVEVGDYSFLDFFTLWE